MNTITKVKERGILFQGDMVNAILRGDKTQTRRIIKGSEGIVKLSEHNRLLTLEQWGFKCPYEVGMVLWVRETWAELSWLEFNGESTEGDSRYVYAVDDPGAHLVKKWKPSLFMPKEACRIRLEITDVRVERLQDISQEDAMAEGVYAMPHRCEGWTNPLNNFRDCYRCAYRFLWNQINGHSGNQWDTNPWVWVVTFRRL